MSADAFRKISLPRAADSLDVDGDHGKISVFELLMQFFHGRHFNQTRWAPGGPKIEKDNLAFKIG